MDLGTRRDTVREIAERKEGEKAKAKARGRKARRKEERKARERATAGKEREIGGTSILIRGGWNRSVVTVVTVGNGVTRRPSALNGRCVVRWNSVQWCHILHRLLFLTLDPLCRYSTVVASVSERIGYVDRRSEHLRSGGRQAVWYHAHPHVWGQRTNQRVEGCLPTQPDFTQKDVAHGHMRTLSYRQGVDQHSSVGTEGHPISCQRVLGDPITMRLEIEQLVRKI